MSYTDNINGIPAQDTVLRQGIATLRNTVISNTIKPLTVDHNGVYTANPNNGTYGYSPVTVDTGVYTGATAPDDSIGKDGDHYYQISKTRYGMKSVNSDYLTSSPMRILANEFYVTSPFKLTGIRINLIAAVNVKYYVLDNTKAVVYESDSIQGAVGWNEHTLTTPITLVANQHYIIAANVQDKGTYTQNGYTTWNTEYVVFVRDLYSQTDNIGGLVNDSVTCMVDPVLETDVEYIIAEYIKDNDAWVSISGSPKMVLSTLNATDNGTYNAPTGTAYSSVSVDVGPEIISRSDWNALTTAQKQAKGLIIIQDASTGFKRGEYINGADYIASNRYIPNSVDSKAICEAYVDNFSESPSAWTWGSGTSPAQYMSNRKPTIDVSENAILVSAYSTGAVPYVDLGATNTPFTAYIVLKAINGSTYSRLVCNVSSRSAGQGIMLYGSNINVSAWADDTPTGVASNDYFVGCIRYGTTSSGFVFDGTNIIKIDKTPASCGRYVTLCRTDINSDSQNSEPCDCFVKYFAVVNEAESDAVIEANIQNLYNEFISS